MIPFIIILFILLSFNLYLTKRRIIAVNKLHTLYSSLELEVLNQKLTPDKKLLTFLKIIKTPVVNNHLLDFSIIFSNLKDIEKDEKYQKSKKAFNSYLQSLPSEVQSITNDINISQNKVVNLSFFKPFNTLLIFCLLVISIIGVGFYSLFKAFGLVISSLIDIPKKVKELYENESVIVSFEETKLYL